MAAERSAHVDTLDQPTPVDAPQAHTIHKAVPFGADQDERARLLRVWSTVSAPLLFLAAAFVLVDSRVGMVVGAAMFAIVFLAIEAIARKQFILFAVSLVAVVVAVLVATAAVQGVLGQWRLVVAALLAAFAGAIMIANLRDLRRG